MGFEADQEHETIESKQQKELRKKLETMQQYEKDSKMEAAIRICQAIGVIKECRKHPGEYIDIIETYYDYEEPNESIKCNPDFLNNFENIVELNHFIQLAIDNSGEECSYCAKIKES